MSAIATSLIGPLLTDNALAAAPAPGRRNRSRPPGWYCPPPHGRVARRPPRLRRRSSFAARTGHLCRFRCAVGQVTGHLLRSLLRGIRSVDRDRVNGEPAGWLDGTECCRRIRPSQRPVRRYLGSASHYGSSQNNCNTIEVTHGKEKGDRDIDHDHRGGLGKFVS